MPEYIRVTDEVKPKREYSIPVSTFDPEIHTEVKKSPATSADGQPLPPKYTPESLSNKGQTATTPKENES